MFEGKIKTLLCLFMLSFLILTFAGCRNEETTEPVGTEEVGEPEEATEIVDEREVGRDDFHNFNNMFDIANLFQEIEVTVAQKYGEDITNYLFLGKDTIEGVETQRVNVIGYYGDDGVIELWINEDNEIVKALENGTEVAMPEMFAMVFFHLHLFTINPDLSWTNREYYSEGTVSRNLGAGSIRASSYTVQLPYTEGSYTHEVAEIAGNKMLIRFQMSEGEEFYDMKITRLIPW